MNLQARLMAAAAALLLGGCSKNAETPTSSTTDTPTTSTVLYAGSLSAGGSRFYSFTASKAGTATVMLASVTSPPRGAALDTPLGLGIGRPAGTGCSLSSSVTTGPALTAQLQEAVGAGIYCVNVYDVGQVSTAVDFVVRFQYP
ncbi:MAG TPA: hypothetical protein VEK56_15165 [Vicinamibacterales bacterium]|nr:hypothetical protein [Vicinamibacterales bacterium]